MEKVCQAELNDALHKGLTVAQRELLDNAHVAIVGLGGLGSNVAVWLARIGVGKLTLIDFDKVELSNLNRQYYFLSDVGKYKAEALLEHLRQINPYGKYDLHVAKLNEDNLAALLGEASIICEAFDNPESKAMLVNAVLSKYPEKYLVAASGIAGFGARDNVNDLSIRKINNHFYLCGDGVSDFTQLPLCGARVGICAAQQALIIARIILGLDA